MVFVQIIYIYLLSLSCCCLLVTKNNKKIKTKTRNKHPLWLFLIFLNNNHVINLQNIKSVVSNIENIANQKEFYYIKHHIYHISDIWWMEPQCLQYHLLLLEYKIIFFRWNFCTKFLGDVCWWMRCVDDTIVYYPQF